MATAYIHVLIVNLRQKNEVIVGWSDEERQFQVTVRICVYF